MRSYRLIPLLFLCACGPIKDLSQYENRELIPALELTFPSIESRQITVDGSQNTKIQYPVDVYIIPPLTGTADQTISSNSTATIMFPSTICTYTLEANSTTLVLNSCTTPGTVRLDSGKFVYFSLSVVGYIATFTITSASELNVSIGPQGN